STTWPRPSPWAAMTAVERSVQASVSDAALESRAAGRAAVALSGADANDARGAGSARTAARVRIDVRSTRGTPLLSEIGAHPEAVRRGVVADRNALEVPGGAGSTPEPGHPRHVHHAHQPVDDGGGDRRVRAL